MSRITKTIAESVAKQLAEPKNLELKELKEKSIELVTSVIKSTIPSEIMEMYAKYPDFFNTHYNTRINCAGFGYEYYKFNTLPDDGDNPKISTQDGNKILSLAHKIEVKEKEYKQLRLEIETALIGLRTYSNVQKEFPEAFKLLPTITTTALTVDLKSIRCKLDKKNCK